MQKQKRKQNLSKKYLDMRILWPKDSSKVCNCLAWLDASKSSANAKPVEFAVPDSSHNRDSFQDNKMGWDVS